MFSGFFMGGGGAETTAAGVTTHDPVGQISTIRITTATTQMEGIPIKVFYSAQCCMHVLTNHNSAVSLTDGLLSE